MVPAGCGTTGAGCSQTGALLPCAHQLQHIPVPGVGCQCPDGPCLAQVALMAPDQGRICWLQAAAGM
jgi:hypothetical protein